MPVLITNDKGLEQPISDGEIEAVCAFVLAREGVERSCEVSITFVDDDEMQELNRTWRGIDRTTDVLSFECDSPFDDETVDSMPEGEPVELGDIVLSPAQITRQAPGFGNTPADECRLMLVHGLLHLLGYDHIDDDEASVMEAREDELLRQLAEQRGDDPDSVVVGPTTNHAHD